jgi:hypothetical protein
MSYQKDNKKENVKSANYTSLVFFAFVFVFVFVFCRKHFRILSRLWLITGFVTRLTRRISLVEQELLTLPEPLSSPHVFSGVRVTRSLVLCVCVVDRYLYIFCWPLLCLFFFDIRILITPLVSSKSSCLFVYLFFILFIFLFFGTVLLVLEIIVWLSDFEFD